MPSGRTRARSATTSSGSGWGLVGVRRGSDPVFLVAARRDAEVAHECAREVALVGEAAERGRIRGRPARGEQAPGEAHPTLDEIGVRRRSDLAREAAQQLEARRVAGARELFE